MAGDKWECPSCGEFNKEERLKCNNCGKAKPGSEEPPKPSAEVAATGADADAKPAERKRRRGWDEDTSFKEARAKSAASTLESIVKTWKPSVDQLKSMTVAQLQPILKTWKIDIKPEALKVIHSIEEEQLKKPKTPSYTMYNPPPPPSAPPASVEVID
eukprot:TRINITY_DN8470_c0_g1_i1.p1 TRINITY_DN8470_c0_g1~~TRINITY_DN8470_c0_g1_i1.p1  ORF type:complete len:158 (-),score=57.67 TRINITY_DN8470_c0_g1_i1:270-743(-)